MPGDGKGRNVKGLGDDGTGGMVYDRGRFFAVTGRRFRSTTDDGSGRYGAAVIALYDELGERKGHKAAASNGQATTTRARQDDDGDRVLRCKHTSKNAPTRFPARTDTTRHSAHACETERFGLTDADARSVMKWWSEKQVGG